MFQLVEKETLLKIDIYPREAIAGELPRSFQVELFPSVRTRIVSLTDFVLSKLLWIQKGSQRSRDDIRSTLRLRTERELASIREAVQSFGLTALFDEVANEKPIE